MLIFNSNFIGNIVNRNLSAASGNDMSAPVYLYVAIKVVRIFNSYIGLFVAYLHPIRHYKRRA